MSSVALTSPEKVEETAPAKINLALHVTGQRSDGYHLLDSLVTFAEDGDELTFAPAEVDSLTLSGRFGSVLALDPAGQDGNLVLRARDLLRSVLDETGQSHGPVAITLDKNLPIASGIGGGSADAAATLRGLMRLWRATLAEDALQAIALKLGADVPMCLASRPLRARGIGEALERIALPSFPIVLVNPMLPVSTPEIFRQLPRKDNPAIGRLPDTAGADDWFAALSALRNDLQPPAEALVPEIAEACDYLRQSLAGFVRMSGSGATCFGLYDSEPAALRAALALSSFRPDWYVLLTHTIAGEPL
ncbi:4-(cytidine 5'-diphospho)-2-C-methyl-D-erythritol kinase [Rhizobium sp. AG855]|uniref:4-(cytidine 5'-diphospho)-2-C-methyl-D-erythritol kinase n=1 Tax=Rhizobium sp. AG855 TaxID=2183898 RepID=UPI000E73E1EE|nr:4-(cytidine 5'-diphospho)-2-C-methyl-D-erythritol kinase [Rhizobium sp. AG855]RKE85939.1 4-diphosphocytidyl-2-C-methyl-D-erythritol kinase [Rhizobium sp. AG855]